jgi:hypothetical protein
MNLQPQNTRTFYDSDETRAHTINSTKPLKYRIMDNATFSQNRYLEYANNLHDIDANSSLRAEPTRLNELDYPTTELYGTAPFKARNAGPVDIESTLLYGERFEGCNKPFTEEHRYFDNRISLPVPLQTPPVMSTNPESTRVLYRNEQMKMN